MRDIINLPSNSGSNEFFNFISSLYIFKESEIKEIHNKFNTYQQLIIKFNNKFNIISHNDLINIWSRHFLDSVIPIKLFPELFSLGMEYSGNIIRSIDIGTGGGLPAIPISIILSEHNITLVESDSGKATFLRDFLFSRLKLDRVRIICDRSENIGKDKHHRDNYDMAFTRAVAKPPVALEYLIPLLKIGGKALFWASGKDWQILPELQKVIETLGGKLYCEKYYGLPGEEENRRKIVVIDKVVPTDEKYPRKPGIPHKKPLC